MSLGPLSLLGVALGTNLLQLLAALGVQLLHLGEDDKRILGVGTQILHRLDEVVAAEWSTVRGAVALVA